MHTPNEFISTITAPYQHKFLTQLKQKCNIQPELDASVSEVTADCLQCNPSYALFCKLCLGQWAWLSKLLTSVKQDLFCFLVLSKCKFRTALSECNHSAYISNGTSVIRPQQSSKDSKVEHSPWDLINSSLPPDGQYFIVCQSVPSKTTTVALLLAESQLVPGAAALYESKTLPTGTILSRKQQLVLRIGWCPRSCYLHLNNWVGKGAASPLLGQSAFY